MKQRLKRIFLGTLKKEPNYVYYFLSFLRGLAYGLIGPVYVLLLFSGWLFYLFLPFIRRGNADIITRSGY